MLVYRIAIFVLIFGYINAERMRCTIDDKGIHPYPGDCRKFYTCDFGRFHIDKCPIGLQFSPKALVCDYPELAGCENTLPTPEESGETGSEESEVEPSKPDPSCIGADLTFHSISDCTKFYQCVGGYKHIFTCPENLYFNEKKQVCDYEENARCGDSVDPEPEESEEPVEPDLDCTDVDLKFHSMPDCNKFYQCIAGHKFILTCPENLYFNEKEQVCDYEENAGCGDVVNPEPEESDEEGEEPAEPDLHCTDVDLNFHSMPDCTKFYQCIEGHKFILTCPENLHFNEKEQLCDYEENAGCGDIVEPKPEESNEESEEPAEPDLHCTDVDLNFHSMPDCTKFYQCLEGHKFILTCPENLYFNEKEQVCDYQENAGCGDIVEPEPEESDEGNEEPSEPDPICEGADLSFHAMPDCTQFYQCVGGYKQIFTCPENLHFNPVEQVCDYPKLAGCDGSSLPEESGETDPEPEESEENSEEPLEPHPDCIDCNMCMKPMPDCTQFYRCFSGQKFIYDCPSNLHFNAATLECDYPESAGCSIDA